MATAPAAPPRPRTFAVLGLPGVGRVFAFSMLGRIPSGALGLLLILRVRDLGGSFGAGGAVAAVAALGYAASAPLLGRLVDQRGQTAVLAVSAGLSLVVLAALALVPHETPLGVLLALGVLNGATNPPLTACMRTLWPALLEDDAERIHAAYSLEAALLEITYILGPLVIVGVVSAISVPLALWTCAAIVVVGSAGFGAQPASRAWRPVRGLRRGLIGALASPGVRTLTVALLCLGASLGAIEVAVTAACARFGSPHAVGLLLGLWGAGSLAGGLVSGRVAAPSAPTRRLTGLLLALAGGGALLAAAGSIATLALLLVVAGVAIAPAFATLYGICGVVARPGTATEAFTWMSSGVGAGIAVGNACGGLLADDPGSRATFLLCGLFALLAVGVVTLWRDTLLVAVQSGLRASAPGPDG